MQLFCCRISLSIEIIDQPKHSMLYFSFNIEKVYVFLGLVQKWLFKYECAEKDVENMFLMSVFKITCEIRVCRWGKKSY